MLRTGVAKTLSDVTKILLLFGKLFDLAIKSQRWGKNNVLVIIINVTFSQND